MTNPILRAFTDLPQDDWHGELTTAELGPICIGVDPITNKSIWYRDRAPAADYATYSDGTPPDPAHENAGDRAARKTAELFAMQKRDIERATEGELIEAALRAAKHGPQPFYYGFRDPPEPAPSFWRPKLDQMGVWSSYLTAAFCVVALVFLFT